MTSPRPNLHSVLVCSAEILLLLVEIFQGSVNVKTLVSVQDFFGSLREICMASLICKVVVWFAWSRIFVSS